ncbi:response regulator [Actinokineospora diospyrosa]|uniref:DNA-binding response regulator, NarL/FixJ family, contains REC and HTH domains n=1 Tax=Actinokineospora diospyrosa TaxID=103728 RepID=A0ABT1I5Y8_9PSEU|nr:response regulator transcription factor [Actinokineospora diospyrosa]MCP2267997.1 DNA-binding response regulator, NarL/FixJ family, contains REC and HTH domains [Actinokineospora diospyrosa]
MITFGEPPGEAGKALFAALRELYLAAGAPTVRAIAERTELSRDTVHRALTADRVPRWSTLQDVVTALDGDVEQFRQLWATAMGTASSPVGSGESTPSHQPDTGAIRVALVDDHPVMVDGLQTMLGAAGFDIVGTALDGHAAVAMVLATQPDVVLMDVVMPNGNGIDATAEIVARLPDARVLMFTMDSREETFRAAVRAGARGFLFKDTRVAELSEVIRAISAGQTHWGHPAAPRLLDEPKHGFTERELTVLELICGGLSRTGIADELGISVRTVDSHYAAIANKIGTRNRVRMALYAIEHGLVAPPVKHSGNDSGR